MPRSQRCAGGELIIGKPAAAYWTWYRMLNDRVCYRAYYCREHILPIMSLLRKGIEYLDADNSEFVRVCMQCGQSIDGLPSKVIYGTFFIPGKDVCRAEFWLCEDCWLGATTTFASDGELLAERANPGQGRKKDDWADLPFN